MKFNRNNLIKKFLANATPNDLNATSNDLKATPSDLKVSLSRVNNNSQFKKEKKSNNRVWPKPDGEKSSNKFI